MMMFALTACTDATSIVSARRNHAGYYERGDWTWCQLTYNNVEEIGVGRIVEFGPPVELTAAKKPVAKDDYATRVAKYVPSEVLAAYVAMMGIVMSMSSVDRLKPYLAWAAFVLCLAVTPIYLYRFAGAKRDKFFHMALSSVAFGFWSYALGGPFEISHLYRADVGSLLLIGFTLVSGALKP